MTAFSIFRPKFPDLSFSCSFKPSSLPTAVLLLKHSYLKDICSTSHSRISPGAAIHKICCVSSEIFNFKVPQLPGEAVLSDKSCFSYFLNLGQFLKLLVVRIEFLELFSCWGMVWNWPEAPGESISTWMNNHVKNCSHMAILRQTFLVRVSSPGHTVCIKLQHFYCSFDIRNR